jgi:quercetin dioxygenase-like cupin family protein
MQSAKLLRTEPPELISKGVSIMPVEGIRAGSEMPVTAIEFIIEPYACSELGASPVTEAFRILSGRGVVLSDNKELHVEPGDWVLIQSNTQHQVRNESAEVLKAVSVSWAKRSA